MLGALIVASGLALPAAPLAKTHLARRRLTDSETPILNYIPGSQVTDHANVDLDQKSIQDYLASNKTNPPFDAAKAVYMDGGHSKPKATCTLVSPSSLGQAVAKKDPVTLTTKNGDVITGKAASSYDTSSTTFAFTYPVSGLQVEPLESQCYVGGLLPADQSTLGCIAETAGQSTFTIAGISYTAECTNAGGRTLQGFSTKAYDLMMDCGPFTHYDPAATYPIGCPYTSFLPYYNYYGVADYGDELVMAALEGGSTNFTNGDMAFEGLEPIMRVEVTKKGTAYLNAWMYAIREMEDAIDDCARNSPMDNALSSGPVHAWDEAVAFYTGSLMTATDLLEPNLPSLPSRGVMPYTLGNKRCANFNTCGEFGNLNVGEAYINIEIFNRFRLGKTKIQDESDCEAVIPIKDEVVSLMTVPLVQGTLRYVWKMAVYPTASDKAKSKAEGAIFAAGILPQLHKCNPEVATLVYDEMGINSDDDVDFNNVKKRMEECYESMGITCQQVGGLWDPATGYFKGPNGEDATPCGAPAPTPGNEWKEEARAAGWAPCKKTAAGGATSATSRRRMTASQDDVKISSDDDDK